MKTNIINVIPTIYMMEVKTRSNNYLLKAFCLSCLSHSKANHQYDEYQFMPTISQNLTCVRCNSMTVAAVLSTYSMSLSQLIYLAERIQPYTHIDFTEPIKFVISPTYLSVLRRNVQDG